MTVYYAIRVRHLYVTEDVATNRMMKISETAHLYGAFFMLILKTKWRRTFQTSRCWLELILIADTPLCGPRLLI